MKHKYFGNGVKVEILDLEFGKSILEPIKVTLSIFKRDFSGCDIFGKYAFCFYDVCTQNVWTDEQHLSIFNEGSLTNDAICAFVKKALNSIFYDAEGYERHLVEILCQRENLLLGDGALPVPTTQYSLYDENRGYKLRIPMLNGGGTTDELLRRINESALPWNFAFALNWIVLKDPSYLNRKFMIRREPGRRDGTDVVRDCQRRVQKVLDKAEAYTRIVNEYRKLINAQ